MNVLLVTLHVMWFIHTSYLNIQNSLMTCYLITECVCLISKYMVRMRSGIWLQSHHICHIISYSPFLPSHLSLGADWDQNLNSANRFPDNWINSARPLTLLSSVDSEVPWSRKRQVTTDTELHHGSSERGCSHGVGGHGGVAETRQEVRSGAIHQTL